MELDAVSFPALVIADDGWVQFVKAAAQLNEWTTSAVQKYSRRRVLLYDHSERLWQVESIEPQHHRNALLKLADMLRKP